MLTKRIIPCLDIKDGRTVKGTNFIDLRDAGDPVELAQKYALQCADELVFLDITATVQNRKTLSQLVRDVAKVINIPFTVGGGISSVEDVYELLQNGADKISINSYAVKDPARVDVLAREFGSQCIVVAIDTKHINNEHMVHVQGGRTATPYRTLDWAREVQDRGAGEILLTSMDHDGVKSGFALELTATLSAILHIPIIASGGAGNMEHFYEAFTQGHADAALAASVFHYQEIDIITLKNYLQSKNLPVRL
ncbi:MAG: imidazole glycerol phosphate synthase subunit HisF [Cytophagales bacterium]|nr:imidazole glycerol phosphate synthase subunit HisF [Cytophagales bacterium]